MFPELSISEFRIRVDDILFPSDANFIGIVMISTGGKLRSLRKVFKISPFLLVSSLATKASTLPSITAGPKSSSNFAISNEQSGNFS